MDKVKYGHPHYFGMFTYEGNLSVLKGMLDIAIKVDKGEVDRKSLVPAIEQMQQELISAGFRECTDTEVRSAIAGFANTFINKPQMWAEMDYFFDPM